MVDRTPLRRQLLKAWTKCLEEDYPRRAINSEHGLQAVLYFHLRSEYLKNLNVFVGPRFKLNSGRPVFPDLVICDETCIVAVIELKYQPRKEKSTGKDLGTLTALAEYSEPLTMQNDRFLGLKCEPAKFTLAGDALFVWAGVHRESTANSDHDLCQKLQNASLKQGFVDRFLQLHAVTSRGEKPRVFSIPEIPGVD